MRIKDSLGYIITNTGRKITQHLTQRFHEFGITSEQWGVLQTLTEEEGITQAELSRRTEKDPTNVTRILDQLERKEFIRRGANKEDRRSYLIHVTESGRSLSQRLLPIETEFTQSYLKDLTEEELALLRQVFQKINERL
ncbi:MarR family winged helix-turn-helix transcriptional regulator [Paenibacillus woosongensis]|uniref:MarR family transcriptional regulator n=1 Tax=Paenibacillus woosongensis TaxID=307580 RepID=A0A7X2Z2R6_9BACL|nr:MarR family transcriptional regulator [Paenibacillus woosongensis]MUG46432.1 MarR family transcriptional regulator [Paenibacillus woosongensis]